MNILIVDDNSMNRKLLRVTLEAEGYNTIEATDGLEALKVLQSEKIDVIISDILMPNMDGYKLCYEVKHSESWKTIPFIIYTSTYTSPSDEKFSLELGADRYIRKPSPIKIIIEAIQELTSAELTSSTAIKPAMDQLEAMSRYSDLLVRKLEEKNTTLEYANQELVKRTRELEERMYLASLSAEISNALIQHDSLLTILQQCTKAIVQHLDVAFARIWTFNRQKDELELQTSAGLYTHIDGPHSRVPIGKLKIGWIAQERRPHITNSVISDPHIADQEWARREGMVSFAGYPLVVEDHMEGVLAVFARKPLTELTLQAITVAANGIALGIKRKRTEQKLRESQAHFRRLLESNIIGILMAELTGKIVEANDAFLNMVGYSREDLITGKVRWDEMTPPELIEQSRYALEEMKVLGSCTPFEKEYIRKDGSRVPVLVGGTFLDGSQNSTISFVIDLTERKHAEEKIREQAALIDITLEAILVRDLADNIIYWNKGAELTYGWTAAEAIGKNVHELLYTKELSQAIKARETVLNHGHWVGELAQVTRSGKEIIIDGHWTLMLDANRQPKSILVVNYDITEKHQLQQQFLRAQRMESVGTLAGGIAHDLNNVLAPILMSVQLLKKKVSDERSRQLLSMMEVSTHRGADLIHQILSFARGVEGERNLVQLKYMLQEIKKVAAETFPRSIAINADLTQDLWPILGDATQLHQVIMNLIVNARDAMPNGGRLSISAENFFIDENYAAMNIEAKPGAYTAISVKDTGSGIPPEILDKIFEPFFTTKEVGKGTGLGLSTVIGIVKSHNGFIKVDSEVGRGTEFKIYFPAVESAEIQQSRDERTELPSGQGELILVVDDELAIREITKASLEAHGYKVLTAVDGVEAITIYVQLQREISAVITDMMMPIMDGPATIRALQKINPQVKIIAVTGVAIKDKTADMSHLGINTLLLKPYTTQQLLNILYKVLNNG